jgi:DNA mismatch repair protein MutS2
MSAYYTLLKLDYLKAVARFSKEIGGKFPKISDAKIFLKSVRHPLLVFTKDHVVPIDIKIEGKRGLVLTWSQHGGKDGSPKDPWAVCPHVPVCTAHPYRGGRIAGF